MDKRYNSDIPAKAAEQIAEPGRSIGGAMWSEKRECTVDGVVAGYRNYDIDGNLWLETPIRNGRKHGTEYSWDIGDNGPILSLSEPYENGLVHGTARQWAPDGTILGTYTLTHGTGYDVWRGYDDHGQVYIAEIHAYKDGYPHGFEWWLNDDQTISSENHYKYKVGLHGIERRWNSDGSLETDYPKFYIDNEFVGKSAYLSRQTDDPDLPDYAEADDKNVRKFPDDVLASMKST